MKNLLLIFCLLSIIMACESERTVSINITSENDDIDSIYIHELSKELILVKAGINQANAKPVNAKVSYTTIGSIMTKDEKKSYLTILYPGKVMDIMVAEDSTIQTNHLGDSLLNYLWTSNNEYIGKNTAFVFGDNEPDTLLSFFRNIENLRRKQIEGYADRLTNKEKDLLLYQNTARINSFLFYLGRIVKKYPVEHEFYSFIKDIDNNNELAKTLYINLLYKHEITYLLKNDSIKSNQDFLDYIASETDNADLSDFLKAKYIKGIISRPSTWEKHEKLLDTQTLKEIVQGEKSNKYYDMIKATSESFFAAQSGVNAYDFTAERVDGAKRKLSELKGKLVFIDSWATWCGPCLMQRPRVLEMADKYKDQPNVEILRISLDVDRESWIKHLTKNEDLDKSGELYVPNAFDSDFSNNYNVKSLPKYILIDPEGKIINANLGEPSMAVEERIDYELTKM
ncbi:TlpA family protein disulfide reductase [Fulvivirga maritima]|uniref:TlpA family protein disulfide reductase n=1 Tax=Fulvivirga maritima TaxID=2904247 RepID=UPI001F3C7DA4|nr:TlpA disulfide reductase family protein [Fulvivirga maritima]UII28296.1 TlpA family protein disulfide reductase [Fulvivirga maritima]